MLTNEIALPPSATIQKTLRETTEWMATEIASPSPAAPDWPEFQWRVAMAVAAMHGVTALLAGRLRWRGPEAWNSFLDEQHQQGLLRQQHTRRLLAVIDAAARLADLPVMALKGSAILDLALYAPGERPMSDVDLLVAAPDFERAGRLIESLDFVEGLTTWKHCEYLPADAPAVRAFGEHVTNPVKIELHGSLTERLPLRDVAITAQVFPADARPGLNPYPSLAALMRHLLLHAAGNICFRNFRLIHLHDIAILANRLNLAAWDELLGDEPGQPQPWWMFPPLSVAARYFPASIPAQVLRRAEVLCPPTLRRASTRYRMTDISLSRLGTPLLPGLEWSRSMAESLSWAITRAHPGRKAASLNLQFALGHHALASSDWTGLSHWKKAVRSLLGRAPRPVTMYSIQRALDYRPAASKAPYSASTRAQV